MYTDDSLINKDQQNNNHAHDDEVYSLEVITVFSYFYSEIVKQTEKTGDITYPISYTQTTIKVLINLSASKRKSMQKSYSKTDYAMKKQKS